MADHRDPIAVLEAAYSLEGTDDQWLGDVHAAFRPILDEGFGTAVVAFEAIGPLARISSLRFLGPVAEYGPNLLEHHEQRCFEHENSGAPRPPCQESWFFLASPPCSTSIATFNAQPRPLAVSEDPLLRDWRMARGASGPRLADILQVRSDSIPGRGVVFGAGRKSAGVPKEVDLLASRLASHIGAMLRLRARLGPSAAVEALERGDAILTAGGRLVHASAEANTSKSREALEHAARMVDRARGKLRRADPETAIERWGALVSGQWSLVDYFDHDGKRFIVAHRNHFPACGKTLRGLGEREQQAVTLASLGHSNKLIAYELGISVSAVSSYLARAAKKLRLASRAGTERPLRPEE